MTARINARIDDVLMRRVERLSHANGVSITDLVRRGLELVCDEGESKPIDVLEAFSAAGFVGSFEGASDLSTRYKSELTATLSRKHDR